MKLTGKMLASKQNLISKFFPAFLGYSNFKQTKIGHCQSQYLMLKSSLISPAAMGTYHILPYAQRSLDKLIQIIENEMSEIDALKLTMSNISRSEIWKATNRWEEFGDELIKLTIGGASHCLNPTHEEEITNLLQNVDASDLSSKFLPIRLFQITNKYRDEMRPRFGLLRAREFLMKDLYTFDNSTVNAMESYHQVCGAYENIFRLLDLECKKAKSSGGNIGGEYSHEYHLLADIGEDRLIESQDTGELYNADSVFENTDKVKQYNSIEIGHCFLLGTLYSKVFNATSTDDLLQMGCYGIGVTRLLAACIEQKARDDNIRFPYAIAPFKVCIIPPKQNSKEEEVGNPITQELYSSLNNSDVCKNDVIIDDRITQTIGWRNMLANSLGFPVIVMIGRAVKDEVPKVEVCFTNRDTDNLVLPVNEAVTEIINDITNNLK